MEFKEQSGGNTTVFVPELAENKKAAATAKDEARTQESKKKVESRVPHMS